MVRIHARQPIDNQRLIRDRVELLKGCYPFVIRFSGFTPVSVRTNADNAALPDCPPPRAVIAYWLNMPTLEPALDNISRDLDALGASSPEEAPTMEEAHAAVAKMRADFESLITSIQQLYDSGILVTSEFSSPALAADSWKNLHEKFSSVLVVLELIRARHPLLEYVTSILLERAISVVRSLVDRADQQYQSYSEKARSEEIPESFLAGLEDIRAGRVVDMEQALNEPPPPRV